MAALASTPAGRLSLVHRGAGRSAPPLPAVPAFPVHRLPEPFRSFVAEGAVAVGVPPELVAVPLLVFAAAAVGRSRRLVLKPDWEVLPVLWAAVVADPGKGKTPAEELAKKGLRTLQREAHRRFEVERAAWEAGNGPAGAGAGAPAVPAAEPRLERLFTTDATMEALAVVLRDAPGLAMVPDELVGWVRSHDQYRSGGDRQKWLSLWSSTDLLIDRVGRAAPLYVESPAVSVVGGVQPDMIRDLHNDAGRRDGFVERILWSYPDTVPQQWSDGFPASRASDRVVDAFRQMRDFAITGLESRVHLDRGAKAAWVASYNANQIAIESLSGVEQGIATKMDSQTARLALVLHCLADPGLNNEMLDRATMEGALELAEYFRAHARRVLPAFGAAAAGAVLPESDLDRRVLAVLEDAGGWVTTTRMHRRLGNAANAADLRGVLEALEEDGLVESQTVQGKTGPPATSWRLVPEDADGDDGGGDEDEDEGGDGGFLDGE